jgi:putative glutamine amidotransferase
MALSLEMGDKPVIGITVDVESEFFKIRRYYSEAIELAGGTGILLPPSRDIKRGAEIIDGLLISGGGDILPEYYGENPQLLLSPPMKKDTLRPVPKSRTDFEMRLLEECINLRKPILGICYGMQLINVFFGGTLYQDIDGHRTGFHDVEIKDNGIIPLGIYRVNTSHHQAIKDTGKGIIILGVSNKDGIIEAITHEKYDFIYGVQWHPERLNNENSKRLFEHFINLAKQRSEVRNQMSESKEKFSLKSDL